MPPNPPEGGLIMLLKAPLGGGGKLSVETPCDSVFKYFSDLESNRTINSYLLQSLPTR